ncbi:MAG: hypothetical protein QOJ99_1568 [Bryobacterales bacterium]|nr:hypothetical protein [Bryobacterales bacterium]
MYGCGLHLEDIYRRLVEIALERVRSGAVSERGLARLCATSQPHLHNVLKNIRSLSPVSADRLMRALNISVEDLLWRRPGDIQPGVKPIPVVRQRVGPGAEPNLDIYMGYYPLAISLVSGVVNPVLARLSPDLLLPRALAQGDLALLDQNPAVRAEPTGNGCWVVLERGGLRVRYVKRRDACVCIANEATIHDPQQWEPVATMGRNILNVVRARIVWISREMET